MGTPFISASHTFLHFPSNTNLLPSSKGYYLSSFLLFPASPFSTFLVFLISSSFLLSISFPPSLLPSCLLPLVFPALSPFSLAILRSLFSCLFPQLFTRTRTRPFPSLPTPLLVLSLPYSPLATPLSAFHFPFPPFPFPFRFLLRFPFSLMFSSVSLSRSLQTSFTDMNE